MEQLGDLFTYAVLGVGTFLGFLVLAFLVIRYFAAGKKGKWRPPDAGLEFMEGLPGSGKSLKAVQDAIRFLVEERRPVYTNLPLVWRVFKEHLRKRGGEELARLLYPIDRGHFVRFCDRTKLKADARSHMNLVRQRWANRVDALTRAGKHEESTRAASRGRRVFNDLRFEARFDRQHGRPIYSGGSANAIHPTAVLMLDEVHIWFPEREQRGKGEPVSIADYLSMLRHHLHFVVCITQNRMQVSLSFRRQMRAIWKVRDRREDKLVFGIRFKHLGIKALRYERYTPEQEESRGAEESAPSETVTVFPWAPWESWKFRLYNSHTHMGSRRALMRGLAQARIAAGMGDDGRIAAEEQRMEEERLHKIERRRPHRMARFVGRQFKRAAIILVIFTIGRITGNNAPQAETNAAPVGTGAEVKKAELKWGKWTGIGPGFVRVGGKRVQVGGSYETARLVHVDMGGRSSQWIADGDVWVWSYGDESPSRVGPAPISGGGSGSKREAAGLVRGPAEQAPLRH